MNANGGVHWHHPVQPDLSVLLQIDNPPVSDLSKPLIPESDAQPFHRINMPHSGPSTEAFIGSEGTARRIRHSKVSEEIAILEVVNKFLSCIKNKDRALMRSLVLPSGAATLIRRGKPVHLNLEAVVERIPVESRTQMEEQIYNSTVHVDGDLGVA